MQYITNLSAPMQKGGSEDSEVFSHFRKLGPSIGLTKLGCCAYVVPPGKAMCPYHAHGELDEMFEGELSHMTRSSDAVGYLDGEE